MTEPRYTLHPQVNVSDLGFPDLPLYNFHIVIVVEPDPATWMITPGQETPVYQSLHAYTELILDEVLGLGELPEPNVEPDEDIVRKSRLITIGENEIPKFFPDLADISKAVFNFADFEFKDLTFYLQGVFGQHPDWHVAVVGATLEDEIIRVANAAQKSGLDTTIVTRYCLSAQSLTNIDDLLASIPPEEHRKMLRRLREKEEKEEDENENNNRS